MASVPGLFKAVGPAEEESGDLDGSLQQMLKAIADERSRLNQRQEVSGLGECARAWNSAKARGVSGPLVLATPGSGLRASEQSCDLALRGSGTRSCL